MRLDCISRGHVSTFRFGANSHLSSHNRIIFEVLHSGA